MKNRSRGVTVSARSRARAKCAALSERRTWLFLACPSQTSAEAKVGSATRAASASFSAAAQSPAFPASYAREYRCSASSDGVVTRASARCCERIASRRSPSTARTRAASRPTAGSTSAFVRASALSVTISVPACGSTACTVMPYPCGSTSTRPVSSTRTSPSRTHTSCAMTRSSRVVGGFFIRRSVSATRWADTRLRKDEFDSSRRRANSTASSDGSPVSFSKAASRTQSFGASARLGGAGRDQSQPISATTAPAETTLLTQSRARAGAPPVDSGLGRPAAAGAASGGARSTGTTGTSSR